jgi:enoyl-CoA hydratase/carnithine racemase
VSVDDGIAQLVLDAPERRNASSRQDWLDLHSAVSELAAGAPLRGLTIRGSDQTFSAGADMALLQELRGLSTERRRELLATAAELVLRLVRFPAPTVALVDGACFGGGASLALACDQVLATARAKFGFVFTTLGLPAGDMGASWLLARRIGARRAWPILASGGVIPADAALELGLVDAVSDVSCDELAASVTWPTGAPMAVRTTKRQLLLMEGAYDPLDALVSGQLDDLAAAVGGPEFAEGLSSLLERRPPKFDR